MSLARLVVTAVRIEGRTKAEVSRDYGVSPRWVYELCRRFDTEGEAGLAPRSRRPRTSPQRTLEAVEEQIIQLRKELSDQGLDAGAHTIAFHLSRRHPAGVVPSVATIWRILSRRGFVTPSPRSGRRARSSGSMPPARSVRGHLQHGAAASGDQTAHSGGGVQRSAQGEPGAGRVHGASTLPGAAGQGGHRRSDHASPRLTAAPHRPGEKTHWHAGPRAGRRSPRPGPDRGR